MSHPGTEETLLDEGESASGPWWRFGFWFWFLFGGFCLVLGLLVFFSPHHDCVSFPFNDDLGTPPTRRPRSWKKKDPASIPASVPGYERHGT